MDPLVSVLMTAYNRQPYIGKAIESVLASDYTHFELIITDDGSVDDTVAIARQYARADNRVKLFVNECNLGDYPNRNHAASLATGKYLKFVDSDDMIYPYGLQVFVEAMERYPEAALGITSRNPIPLDPFPILLTPRQAYRKHFFDYGILDYGPTGVIIRRDLFEQYGRFSGKRYIGDQECWLKIAALHPVIELPPSLTFWRQHEGQEFKAGMGVHGGYFAMMLPLLREVLASPNCPLEPAEKQQVLKQQQKSYARALVKHALTTGQLATAGKKFRELKLSVVDIF
jgi:glycosyltransferase involved in cell wall biosynthesis